MHLVVGHQFPLDPSSLNGFNVQFLWVPNGMNKMGSDSVGGDNILELDARGLVCPLPLLKAKQSLNKMQSGECLRVLATDQGSVRDFRAFADLSGHELIEQSQQQDVYVHVLQKA